jgi:hypothetical protein
MGKYDDIAPDITLDPPARHPLAGRKVKIITQKGEEIGKIIHVFGDNQFYLVTVTDYTFFMNRRFECLRSHHIKLLEV